MEPKIVGQILQRAAEDRNFRGRALQNLGIALAEEGFILSDTEMKTLRTQWEALHGMNDAMARERLHAMAWPYREER